MSIDTGAFLRGLTKGMMATQEMRTQREEREERKSERALQMERWKTDYLDRTADTLEAITDPADWERHLSRFDERGSVLGFEPGEVRRSIGAFPEERRNKAREKAAREKVSELQRIYEGRFWTPEVQGFMVPFEGQTIAVRDLVSIADILATREVKRPIRGEVQVPRAEEGGLARFLTPRTEERIIGEETVREPALPIPAQPLTFDMLYEKAKGTPWEGRPITLKDGVPDLRLATQIAKDNGWIVTNEDQSRSRERYQKFLREKLTAGMRAPGSVDLGTLRKQMEQAGMNWAAEMDKAKQNIALAAATLAQKVRAAEGGDRSGLSAGQNRIVTQYDDLDRQDQSALGMISRAIDPDAPEIVELRNRVKDLRQRKARIFQQNPWIAPYIGVAPPSPEPTGGDEVRGGRTITMREVQAIAQVERQPIASVIKDVKEQGYTVIEEPAPKPPARPPAPPSKPLPIVGTRIVAGRKIPVQAQQPDRPLRVPRIPGLPPAPTPRVANLLRLVRQENRTVSTAEWRSLNDQERKWLRTTGVEIET